MTPRHSLFTRLPPPPRTRGGQALPPLSLGHHLLAFDYVTTWSPGALEGPAIISTSLPTYGSTLPFPQRTASSVRHLPAHPPYPRLILDHNTPPTTTPGSSVPLLRPTQLPLAPFRSWALTPMVVSSPSMMSIIPPACFFTPALVQGLPTLASRFWRVIPPKRPSNNPSGIVCSYSTPPPLLPYNLRPTTTGPVWRACLLSHQLLRSASMQFLWGGAPTVTVAVWVFIVYDFLSTTRPCLIPCSWAVTSGYAINTASTSRCPPRTTTPIDNCLLGELSLSLHLPTSAPKYLALTSLSMVCTFSYVVPGKPGFPSFRTPSPSESP